MVYREGNDDIRGVCPAPAAVLAANEFPGIAHAVRMDSRGVTLKAENSEAIDHQVHFTDEGFFDVFNFPVVKGSNDLSDHSAVLITEQIAEKLYGKSDPIGKSIIFYAGDSCQIALKVAGVLKKLPMNTMMWFQMITHWDNLRSFDCQPVVDDNWGYLAGGVFF